MPKGFARVAAVSVPVHLGDVAANENEILVAMETLAAKGVQLAVFPELCLCGYTLGDLLIHPLVKEQCWQAMLRIAEKTGDMAVVVGLPVECNSRMFNCAAVLQNGQVKGIVPKLYLSNGNEFYETRWFVSGDQAPLCTQVMSYPFGAGLLFEMQDFTFAVEICEDLWSPIPPSCLYAVAGAEIIVNLSASNIVAGKHAYRGELLRQQSGRLYAGYVYAGAGYGESTADLVFCGYTGVYENGRALCEGPRFTMDGGMAVADIDVERLRYQRQRNGSFYQVHQTGIQPKPMQPVVMDASAYAALPLLRPMDALPFLPTGQDAAQRMDEIVNIQTMGLMTRLKAIWCKDIVIGISGGLDSTMALLIAALAFDRLGMDRKGIHAITMPGMGTGKRTKSNADRLMEALGVSASEIDIRPAVLQHFKDIAHDENNHDVTYENCQARERTQILMDYANKVNGIVLGTGDMSEMALGFCTYNGDHMSMYNPNCSVPKTLMRGLVKHLSETCFDQSVREVCADILDTPVSPELLPNIQGELTQRTEDILGDYALHDFFLYHMMDSGASPDKLRMLAAQAFEGVYGEDVVDKQLSTFIRKFFTSQFKRNCVPDGPKVGSVSLSPRGDWRMPSDMNSVLWKGELRG